MKKTLLLALAGLYSFTLFAQTIQYAQDPIPFKEANDDQLQLVGSDGFTHAWVYNSDKLSLTVYNKELQQVAKHTLYNKQDISRAPYFQLSFPSHYYVVLPLKGTNNIYKIFPDGTSQEIEGPNRPSSSPRLGNIRYLERLDNRIYAVEETRTANGKVLFVLNQFDESFQPVGQKQIIAEQPAGQRASYYFKALDTATFVTGRVVTNGILSSVLTVSKVDLLSGTRMEKKFQSSDAEFTNIRFLKDDNSNLYIVNQVSIFPTDTLIKLRKETSYINKINKNWEAEGSLSLEGNLPMDSSRRVSLFNTHSFLINGVLLNVSSWTTGMSYYLSSFSTNEGSQPRIPQSGVSYLQWQTTAKSLTAAPRADRPVANTIYDLNPAVVESYMTPISTPLPTRTYKGPNYWKMPVQEFQHLAVMGTDLTQLHPKRIDYPQTDALFQANNKVFGFYQKDKKLCYYELHQSEGARGLKEQALNPRYNYLPWKLAQADASTYLLPYLYKKNLYFVKLRMEQ